MFRDMTDDPPFPPLDTALVHALDRLYPDRLPTEPVSDFELGKQVGARAVVRFLQETHEQQQAEHTMETMNVFQHENP